MRRISAIARKSRSRAFENGKESGDISQPTEEPSILPFPGTGSRAPHIHRNRLSNWYILPSKDVDIRCVEIPRMGEREIREFLRYRLRSIYPGNPDQVEFDHRLFKSRGSQHALLCVCQKETLSQHKVAANGRKLCAPSFMLPSALPDFQEGNVLFLFFGELSIEADVFDNGQFQSMIVLPRDAAGKCSLQKLESLADRWSFDRCCSVIHYPADEVALRKGAEFLGDQCEQEIVTLESTLAHLKKRDALFASQSRQRQAIGRLIIPVLLAVLLLLAGLVGQRAVVRETQLFDALRAQLSVAEKNADETVQLKSEIETLQENISRLGNRTAAQPYTVLSLLYDVLGSEAQVFTFFLENGFFQIDAAAKDPLAIMQEFEDITLFSNLRITQILPSISADWQRFTMTGEVNER